MSDACKALYHGAGQIDLSSRGRIRVTGEDRARLLHAMTTNHVTGLQPGSGCYAFFLNAQGRILADVYILCFDDYFLLDTEPETRKFVLEHLDKFIIADDVIVEDLTESTGCLGIEGPLAENVLRKMGLALPEAPVSHVTTGRTTVVRASVTGGPGFRLLAPEPLMHPELLVASGIDAYAVRLEHFFPRYGDDITIANLPQETGITDALHFNKGCYLGQEIVERVRSRGHVNRLLVGMRVEGEAPIEARARVSFAGNEVGEITSACISPLTGVGNTLGYLRINAAKPGTEVFVEGRPAQVVPIKSSRT
jgi:aminomethyltransferase